MDIKISEPLNPTYVPQVTGVPPHSTVNVHITESGKRKNTNFWAPFYALGVFGCMCLLFHLYVSASFHHAAMDHGLHKLEEEVHAMMKMHHTAANSTSSGPVSVPVATAHATYAEWHRALADHVLPHERRHHSTSKRAKSRMTHVQPVKRDGSVLTWFLPGAGACGGHNGPNDYIIAISHLIWNGGAHCGDTVTISYHGKTAQATIVDECMGCESGHIDLSPGLLHYLAGPGTDMVTDANWSFGVPEPPSPSPSPPPPPKPTPTYTPTTKAEPTPSSTSSTKTTTTSTSSSASSSVSSSTALYTSASASAVPPSYVDDGAVHNMEDIQVLLVSFGNMVVSGASAKA